MYQGWLSLQYLMPWNVFTIDDPNSKAKKLLSGSVLEKLKATTSLPPSRNLKSLSTVAGRRWNVLNALYCLTSTSVVLSLTSSAGALAGVLADVALACSSVVWASCVLAPDVFASDVASPAGAGIADSSPGPFRSPTRLVPSDGPRHGEGFVRVDAFAARFHGPT
jgi:hypothetical protein